MAFEFFTLTADLGAGQQGAPLSGRVVLQLNSPLRDPASNQIKANAPIDVPIPADGQLEVAGLVRVDTDGLLPSNVRWGCTFIWNGEESDTFWFDTDLVAAGALDLADVVQLTDPPALTVPTAGADGREVELQTTATHVQWRYVGDAAWTNLFALADVGGGGGGSTEMDVIADGNFGAAITLALTDRTGIEYHTGTLDEALCTVTLPSAATAGEFTLELTHLAGAEEPTFTGVRWFGDPSYGLAADDSVVLVFWTTGDGEWRGAQVGLSEEPSTPAASYLLAEVVIATDGYIFQDLTGVTDYVVQAGDVLEYELWWNAAGTQVALDLGFTDGTNLRDSGLVDQNGIGVHPQINVSDVGAPEVINGWYPRTIDLATLVGKTIRYYDVASERNAGSVTARFRGANITDGAGTVRKQIWDGGAVPANAERSTNDVANSVTLSVVV